MPQSVVKTVGATESQEGESVHSWRMDLNGPSKNGQNLPGLRGSAEACGISVQRGQAILDTGLPQALGLISP